MSVNHSSAVVTLPVTRIRPLREELENLTYHPQDAAKVLGIGRDAMYKLVRDGKVKALRVGIKLRIPKKALEQFIDSELAKVGEI